MKNIAIIGSGDLAKQVISLIHEIKQHTIYGIYDDFCKEKNVEEYKLKGGTDLVRSHYSLNYFDYIFIAVGYKRFKYKNEIYHRFKNKVPLVNIIHKSCTIHSKSVIGEGILMFPNVVVDYNAVIEDNVVLNISSTISHDSKIKKNSYISPAVNVSGFVEVGQNCFLGTNATLSDNIRVCENTVVGAGSVVVSDINSPGVYVGNPSKKIK